jgi:hypothetical protein
MKEGFHAEGAEGTEATEKKGKTGTACRAPTEWRRQLRAG